MYVQKRKELQGMGKEERQKILREAGVHAEITPEDGIAMKTDLGIPWNKIRHIRRFEMALLYNYICKII